MNETKLAILITLFAIFVKGKKHYVTPAPNTILLLLEKFHEKSIHRRWLFECLLFLREKKFIRTKRRWLIIEDNEIRSIPSMVTITTKGVQYLSRKMVAGAKSIYKQMLTWLNRGDKRWPAPVDLVAPEQIRDAEGGLKHIREIIQGMI